MTKLCALLVVMVAAGCAKQGDLGPARSTGQPFDVNDRELETPGSLPPGFTTNHPFAPSTGVINQTRVAP